MESQPPAPGPDASPRPGAQPSDAFAQALYARLRSRTPEASRYAIGAEIGHGGMGRVYAARDEDLQRDVALKVIREAPGEGDTSGGPSPSSLRLARFLEEAQVTGQLDHPGIVPVHELGLDANGRLYFAMKLVRGEDLSTVLKRVGKDPEWTQTRVVGVLQKVCEAMAYAHSKRVIHRDLKPSNIRIGRFGAVYVMDWGLARVLDRPDERDLRVRAEDAPTQSDPVRSDRQHAGELAQLLHTVDGTPIGTPMFMSPEQALGRAELMGPQTDVYGVGAILYMLLTGQMPYVSPFSMVNAAQVVRWIREGPPTPILELAPKATAQLVAIAERAMARDPAQRYAHMGELADELRAYLELRVVRAYRTGPVAEFGAWVRRNRSVAALAGALLVLAISSGFGVAWQRSVAAEEVRRSADALDAIELSPVLDRVRLNDPNAAAQLDAWESSMQRLVARKPEYEREASEILKRAEANGLVTFEDRTPSASAEGADMSELKVALTDRDRFAAELANPKPPTDPELSDEWRQAYVADVRSILPRTVAYLDERIAHLRLLQPPAAIPRLTNEADQLHYELLVRRAQQLHWLEVEGARQLKWLRAIESAAQRVQQVEWENAWRVLRVDLESEATQGPYGALSIEPRRDLLPLGRDRLSGLWEFWHIASGERPVADERGSWRIGPDTGIVFVLVPGGPSTIGASNKPDSKHFDAQASPIEFITSENLEPYALSKYEMTQGQYLRLAAVNPSRHFAGGQYANDRRVSLANPVESITYEEAARVLSRVGMQLPTEMQFEHAARAGADQPLPVGSLEQLRLHANYLDSTLINHQKSPGAEKDPTPGDGWAIHAPVGSFTPNAFGLHDLVGNVAEWTRDWLVTKPDDCRITPGTGERVPARAVRRVVRGGAFNYAPSECRLSYRYALAPSDRLETVGFRAALTLRVQGQR
jgi:serine/threonine protein kinase/formylglycine-generating enzyme required for sulfatase activity